MGIAPFRARCRLASMFSIIQAMLALSGCYQAPVCVKVTGLKRTFQGAVPARP